MGGLCDERPCHYGKTLRVRVCAYVTLQGEVQTDVYFAESQFCLSEAPSPPEIAGFTLYLLSIDDNVWDPESPMVVLLKKEHAHVSILRSLR